MPIDLDQLVDPYHTALVVNECQEGALGPESTFPELARAARRAGMVEHIAELLTAARPAGVKVVHSVVGRRPDDRGSNRNARLFIVAARSPQRLVEGSPAAAVVSGIDVTDDDIVVTRRQGLAPMSGTELDPLLRNMGCTTIVVAGVSLNVAIQNLAFDAVNRGYQCVVPRDAVAGTPAEYAEQVLHHTLPMVATVTDSASLAASWSTRRAP